jgi:hypothetical protein
VGREGKARQKEQGRRAWQRMEGMARHVGQVTIGSARQVDRQDTNCKAGRLGREGQGKQSG